MQSVFSLVFEVGPTGGVITAAILVICVTVFSYILIYMSINYRNNNLILSNQVESSKRLLSVYENYNKDIAEKEKTIYTMRHDFRHILNNIIQLSQEHDAEGIKKIADEFTRYFDGTEMRRYSSNKTINSILTYFMSLAERNQTDCTVRISIKDSLPIGDVELMLILGNALENSIKATAPLKEKGYVHIKINSIKDCTVFQIKNNYEKASYEKGSGLGLPSIRTLVDKLGGEVRVTDEQGVFALTVILIDNQRASRAEDQILIRNSKD